MLKLCKTEIGIRFDNAWAVTRANPWTPRNNCEGSCMNSRWLAVFIHMQPCGKFWISWIHRDVGKIFEDNVLSMHGASMLCTSVNPNRCGRTHVQARLDLTEECLQELRLESPGTIPSKFIFYRHDLITESSWSLILAYFYNLGSESQDSWYNLLRHESNLVTMSIKSSQKDIQGEKEWGISRCNQRNDHYHQQQRL